MKILLLSGKLDSGGAPRVCYQIARHLSERIELTVAFLGGEDGLIEPFERADIPVKRLAERPISLNAARALNRHLHNYRYDLVHTHMMSAGLIGRPVAKMHGIPVIHTIHTNYEMRPIKAKIADVFSATFGDLAISVSESVDKSLPAYYLSKREIVYNCIDIEKIREEASVAWTDLEWTDNLNETAPIVANVARYDPKKRRIDLIDSFQSVLDQFPNAQLVLTGRRVKRQQQLAQRTRELGISANVYFVGFVENPQTVYQHADVIALPSESEGFSIGMLEAMVHRKPVVASKIPAFVDALGEDYPGYVPVRSPEALGETLCSTLTDPSYREEMKEIMADRIERFSGDRAANAYLDLYQAQTRL
ncbi:glycosyltransferase [Halomontanus rarus]|uniref:glycosyltransferase n=1 Tax=Halomontanus rarus TaxID=3034020 RepID=UPI0023E80EA5|nr:glycosyltransferase [Halovivax sp. TS33]